MSAVRPAPLLVAAALTAALAGLLFGFDTAVIAGVTDAVRARFALGPVALGITVSAALWGTLAGALGAGVPGDRFGARRTLEVLALFYLVSGLGSALAWDWASLLAFRFVGGLAIGGSSVLAPVYLAELAPASRRGAVVGLFQFAIVSGILLAYLSNAGVALAVAAPDRAWRAKLEVAAVPAAVLWFLLRRIPDSPRWLAAKGRTAEAARALAGLGRAAAEPDVAPGSAVAVGERLSWREHRRPIMLAVLVAAFNQLSGINAILYYLNQIFADAGYGGTDRPAVAVGVANLLFTGLGMALIDRAGRRALLMGGRRAWRRRSRSPGRRSADGSAMAGCCRRWSVSLPVSPPARAR